MRFINVIGLSLLLGFLGLFALAQGPTQQTECPPPGWLVLEETEASTDLSEQARQALLSWVDRTVQNNYVDPNYGGLDWERVISEYEPRVTEAETDQEVYDLLKELVGRLQDERSEFLSPEGVRAAEAFRRNVPENFYGIGVNVNFSHDNRSLHVQQVYPGGSASEAGIRRRDRILMVDGEPCPAPVKIRGPEGSEVTLTVQSPGEEPRELTLERRPANFTEVPLSYRFAANPEIAY
nr:PDZ domain-containing protein [Deinococcota bacterium]